MFYSKSNKQTMYNKTVTMYLTSSNLKSIRKTDLSLSNLFKKKKMTLIFCKYIMLWESVSGKSDKMIYMYHRPPSLCIS